MKFLLFQFFEFLNSWIPRGEEEEEDSKLDRNFWWIIKQYVKPAVRRKRNPLKNLKIHSLIENKVKNEITNNNNKNNKHKEKFFECGNLLHPFEERDER